MYDEPAGVDEPEGAAAAERGYGGRLGPIVGMLLDLGLGLALIYFLLAAMGAVDLIDSATFTVIAVVLLVAWGVGAVVRSRSGETPLVRRDRERRGF